MLVWIVTIFLVLIAIGGWLFLKRNSDRYLHGQESSINFFFKWGHFCHHVFKIVIIALFMIAIFSLYKYLLNVSEIFALISAIVAGIILAGGKELLDKAITPDDVFISILALIFGFFTIFLFF